MNNDKIIYTLTDEAPALATYSLLPIVQAFTKAAGCVVETRDFAHIRRLRDRLQREGYRITFNENPGEVSSAGPPG